MALYLVAAGFFFAVFAAALIYPEAVPWCIKHLCAGVMRLDRWLGRVSRSRFYPKNARSRIAAAFGAYAIALLMTWCLVAEDPSDIPIAPKDMVAMAVSAFVLFPIRFGFLTGGPAGWMNPVLPHFIYVALFAAIALAENKRLFFGLITILSLLLTVNVVGCVDTDSSSF
jgi:hypothetical protein